MSSPLNCSNREKIKLSDAEEYILTVLQNRELYGLELLHELNRRLDLLDRLSHNKLYSALNRLNKKGLISCRWGDEGEKTGGGKRKYYSCIPRFARNAGINFLATH